MAPGRRAVLSGLLLMAALVAGGALLLPRASALRFVLALQADVPEDGEAPPGLALLPGGLPGAERVRVGRPHAPGHGTLLLVHGVTEQGVDDGRLLRLAEAARRAGFLVVLPQLPPLVTMEVEPGDAGRLQRVLDALEEGVVAGVDPGRVGVLAISVGGGHAVRAVAAHRSAGGSLPAAMLLVGAPDDMRALAPELLERPREHAVDDPVGRAAAEAGLFARNALLRYAARRLVPTADRELVRTWMAGAWTPMVAPAGVTTPEGRRHVALALDGAPLPEGMVAPVLGAVGDLLDLLSPARASPEELAALDGLPVHLLHGTTDPLVPLAALERLAARLRPHARVTTLASRLVTHTDVGGGDVWAHVRFVDAFFDAVRHP